MDIFDYTGTDMLVQVRCGEGRSELKCGRKLINQEALYIQRGSLSGPDKEGGKIRLSVSEKRSCS